MCHAKVSCFLHQNEENIWNQRKLVHNLQQCVTLAITIASIMVMVAFDLHGIRWYCIASVRMNEQKTLSQAHEL